MKLKVTLLKKSFQCIQEAQKAIDYQLITLDEKSSQTWQERYYPVYEQAVRLAMLGYRTNKSNDYMTRAFFFVEQSRARFLQAQIKGINALQLTSIPDRFLKKEYDLRTSITFYDKRRFQAISSGQSETDSIVLNIDSKRFDLRQERDALIKTFETQYPDYYRLKYDTRVVDVTTVQNNLLTPNQTLLEYFVGDSSIYAFVISPDKYTVKEIKKDFPLEEWVESLRKDLSENYQVSLRDYVDKGHKLYEKLVAPVADLLSEELVIIPDGVLGYLPFEALLTAPVSNPQKLKAYPYWLKDKQISYCYSATLLKEMMDKKHRKTPSEELLAFAPFYDGDTTLFTNLFSPYTEQRLRSEGLKPLPHSGEEAYRISQMMGGTMYADKDATEDRFIQLASDYRILHLATHGQANDKSGDYSFLAFTEIKDSLENELLYLRDLYNLQLNADMVVLSACETGIGELQRGEGIISLARGFTYAGAKSIFTTLWSVSDERTKDLNLLFYQHLKDGKRKDAALRQAKLDYIQQLESKEQIYAHPYFWSGMIGIGDMRRL